MKTILIKSAKYLGQDSRTFRAYHADTLKPIGVSANSTGGAVTAAGMCAVKAFIKLVEPSADADEIRTRISLREVLANPLTYAAELQSNVEVSGGASGRATRASGTDSDNSRPLH